MLIGILSDSHGDHALVRQSLALFDGLGVQHVIHCGDVGGTDVFDELVGRSCSFVWGNMDLPDDGLLSYLDTVDLSLPNSVPLRLTLANKSLAVFHGHEAGFGRAVASLGVDYIFHGHTHVARDERRGHTRIINPGALHRARRKTVATLDLETDHLAFLDAPESAQDRA